MKVKNCIYPSISLGLVLMLLSIYSFGQANKETVTDIDGNVYNTVIIGYQTWMVEDLKVTKYNSGVPIQLKIDKSAWENDLSGAYCWYNNDIANKSVFGALYNWYAVNTGNLAPKGWHVPSREEWQILIDYLGGEKLAGGKLKASGTSFWTKPNKGADNSSGFTALPGGARFDSGSEDFYFISDWNFWWTSTKSNLLQARSITVLFNTSKILESAKGKNYGFAVRCIKD